MRSGPAGTSAINNGNLVHIHIAAGINSRSHRQIQFKPDQALNEIARQIVVLDPVVWPWFLVDLFRLLGGLASW